MSSESLVRKEDEHRSAEGHSTPGLSIANSLPLPSIDQKYNPKDFTQVLMEFLSYSQLCPERRVYTQVENRTPP